MLAKIRHAGVPLAALALIVATTSTAGAATAVQDPIPIRPDMYFVGLVNGNTAQAIIKMACPVGAADGHPISGQTVEVETMSPIVRSGFTGSAANSIDAIFTAPGRPITNPAIVLTSFFAPEPIPTSFVLPCSGSGTVSFVPIPTSPTARGYAVQVTFANITTGG